MIAVFTTHPELLPQAHALADQLALPFQQDADYLLLLTPECLCLQKTGEKSLPLVIDFSSKRMSWRCTNTSLRKEALARAMGLKNHTRPYIIDATAGLGRDSFILASLGFEVEMIERSPVIYALLKDGIHRGLQDETLAPIIKRMRLIHDNAIVYLKNCDEKPNIIYLDPMFPERKKSALSRLDMRIFHDVAGDDEDGGSLLQAALACASERVVVKRPRLAHSLANIKPAYSLTGSSSRFDIYII